MGVDTVIALPDNTRVQAVSDVISRLFGCPGVLKLLPEGGKYFHCPMVEVKGVVAVPEMVDIVWRGGTVKGWESGSWYFHYESDEPGYRHVLMPRSRPEAIAVGVELVDFFGGKLLYADLGDGWDLEVPAKPDRWNRPEDGEEWQAAEYRVWGVQPITKQQIKACRQYAAYED